MGAKGSEGKPLTAAQQAWLEHLQRCEAQRCSSVAYAREHGLSVTALYTARKALTERGHFRRARRSAPSPVTLVPVRMERPVPSMAPAPDGVLRVVLPNGVRLEVPEGTTPARCQALAAALLGVGR